MTDQPPDDPRFDRRDFIIDLAGMLMLAHAGRYAPASSASGGNSPNAAGNFVGIQMGPHTMLDEGIEHTLDLVQEAAAVNTIMPYSHGYNGAFIKPLTARANHGVPLTDNAGRKFPLVWVRTRDQYYKNTTLRHQVVDSSFEHHNRDLFTEIVKPARARGMKVYARVLE